MNEWFDDKTIAIVGNAKSLFDKKYGDEIDSHDVVIRINRGLEICTNPRLRISHGGKVDVWCFNLYRSLENFDRVMKNRIPQHYKKLQMNYEPYSTKFDSSMSEDAIKEILHIFAPKKTTTGFRILHYMTKFNPASVNVYGFDWKETPTYYTYFSYNVDKNHDYAKEKKYCFENYFDTGKFELKS